MRFIARLGLAACCSVAFATLAVAQTAPPTPEEQAQMATETRQGLFKLINHYMAPLAGMIRKRTPFDAALAEKNAQRIQQLSPMIVEVFAPDTRKFQVKTQAREGIWASMADFSAKADDLGTAAAALAAAAKSGDQGATLKAAAAVGKACGNCHDNFRDK